MIWRRRRCSARGMTIVHIRGPIHVAVWVVFMNDDVFFNPLEVASIPATSTIEIRDRVANLARSTPVNADGQRGAFRKEAAVPVKIVCWTLEDALASIGRDGVVLSICIQSDGPTAVVWRQGRWWGRRG